MLYNEWKDQEKTIINISSNSSDGIKNKVHAYAVHKAALDKASQQLATQKNKCQVINIRPEWIDVERVLAVEENKIDPHEIAVIIDNILKFKTCVAHELTIYPNK